MNLFLMGPRMDRVHILTLHSSTYRPGLIKSRALDYSLLFTAWRVRFNGGGAVVVAETHFGNVPVTLGGWGQHCAGGWWPPDPPWLI